MYYNNVSWGYELYNTRMATGVKFDSSFLTLRIYQYITIRLIAGRDQYHFTVIVFSV